jgi:hypothetical protein
VQITHHAEVLYTGRKIQSRKMVDDTISLEGDILLNGDGKDDALPSSFFTLFASEAEQLPAADQDTAPSYPLLPQQESIFSAGPTNPLTEHHPPQVSSMPRQVDILPGSGGSLAPSSPSFRSYPANLYDFAWSNAMSCRTLERDVYAIISNSLQQQACAHPVAIAQGLTQQHFAMMASQSQHGVFAQQQPLQMSAAPDHNTNDKAKVLNGLSHSEDGATNKLAGTNNIKDEAASFVMAPNAPSSEEEVALKR